MNPSLVACMFVNFDASHTFLLVNKMKRQARKKYTVCSCTFTNIARVLKRHCNIVIGILAQKKLNNVPACAPSTSLLFIARSHSLALVLGRSRSQAVRECLGDTSRSTSRASLWHPWRHFRVHPGQSWRYTGQRYYGHISHGFECPYSSTDTVTHIQRPGILSSHSPTSSKRSPLQ